MVFFPWVIKRRIQGAILKEGFQYFCWPEICSVPNMSRLTTVMIYYEIKKKNLLIYFNTLILDTER